MNIEKIIITILVVTAVGGLVWSASDFFRGREKNILIENTPENFTRSLQAELPDKCKTPEGYTNDEWQEHMSHHPDRYTGCL